MNGIVRLNDPTPEDRERAALTPADYAAAGVDAPNWEDDPVPTIETWRRWQQAENEALAFKRAAARAE